jgi:hypothetical protein
LEPEDLARLRLLAPAGMSFPEALAEGLFEHAGHPRQGVADLVERGFLVRPPGGRLRFVTSRLQRAVTAAGGEEPPEIDRWLLENQVAEPDNLDEVVAVALRARRRGDRAREAATLARAFRLDDRAGLAQGGGVRRPLREPS